MGETSVVTGVPVPSDQAWVSTGDFDADGVLDLFVLDSGTLTVWSVDSDTGATAAVHSVDVPVPSAAQVFLGDRDLDHRPDLWTLDADGGTVRLAADGYGADPERIEPSGLPANLVDVAAADYDGDGRRDLITFDGLTKRVWLGNTPMPDGQRPELWFEFEEPECGENEPEWDAANTGLSFSSLVSRGSYGWRSDLGLPVGCDPEDDECVLTPVTNEQLVEFLAWAANLEPAGDDPSIAAAKAVHRANLAAPCRVNDAPCWERPTASGVLGAVFTLFLYDRSGIDFEPHHWYLPAGVVRAKAMTPG